MKFKSYKSDEIGLEFKVWAPSFNRVDQRLYLLGSLKELGAWAFESALEAYPTKDLQIWSVQTALPPRSRFEWVWLKINVKTKKVSWERSVKRNRIVGCFSGVLHSIWGEQQEVFLQSAAHVDITTFKKVEAGSVLALTGSVQSLGNWDLRRAVMAKEFPDKSGFWKASICFDADTNVEFKWVVVNEKSIYNVLAAEKLSHHLYGRNTWMRVAAPWMTTSTTVVDILPLDEKLDNKMGRTDIIVQTRMKRLAEIRTWMAKGRDSIDLLRPFPSAQTSKKNKSRIVHDLDMCAALKALWTIMPKENGELDVKTTDQPKKTWSAISNKIFAIKGVGQNQVPTDAMNLGCLHWSDSVPEGDRRVLEYPACEDVSLWTISMEMAKILMQPVSEQENSGTDNNGTDIVPKALQEAQGDDSRADKKKVVSKLDYASHPNIEEKLEKETFITEHFRDEINEHKEERLRHKKEILKKQELVNSTGHKYSPQMFTEVDDAFIVENENNLSAKSASCENRFSLGCTQKEITERQQNKDFPKCLLRQLDIFHSDEIRPAEEIIVKPSISETMVADSGLASLGPDIYASRSSNECSSNESEVSSLMEDLRGENYERNFITYFGEKRALTMEETEKDINKCLLPSDFLRDEGFFSSDFVHDYLSGWGKMLNDPFSEDASEGSECEGASLPYWEKIQHSREMTLPLFATAQKESDVSLSVEQDTLHPQNESPPKLSIVKDFDNIKEQGDSSFSPPYITKAMPPLASAPDRTLEYLYKHHSGPSYWRYWVQGTELDFCDYRPLEGSLEGDTPEPNISAGDADVLSPNTTSLNKTPLKNESPKKLADERSPLCGQSLGKQSRESGDAPNYNVQETFDYFDENAMFSKKDRLVGLLDSSFEDLTTCERRLIAQALESEWGRCSFTKCRESEEMSETITAKNAKNENPVFSSLMRSRRKYQTVCCSVKELQDMVERDSTLEDRRAQARRAEFMWGLAASSKCRWKDTMKKNETV